LEKGILKQKISHKKKSYSSKEEVKIRKVMSHHVGRGGKFNGKRCEKGGIFYYPTQGGTEKSNGDELNMFREGGGSPKPLDEIRFLEMGLQEGLSPRGIMSYGR